MRSKREVLETWFQKVWTEESVATIYEMFVPQDSEHQDVVNGLSKETALGPKEFEQFHQAMLALIGQVKVSMDFSVEQGDWIISECTLTAVNRKSGGNISIKGCATARVVDGKIVEANNHFDFLHLFEGLDLLPKNTFEHCLQGNPISV